MDTLSKRLAARGWRMTAQRRVIAGVFDVAPDGHLHLTADEVLERAVAVFPEISRATVYNTLGELVDAGELLAVQTGGRVTRYDPNVPEFTTTWCAPTATPSSTCRPRRFHSPTSAELHRRVSGSHLPRSVLELRWAGR